MFCPNCGTKGEGAERFCQNCGSLVNQVDAQKAEMNSNLDPNYINRAVNPGMKKFAILSVIVPIVAIVFYFFVGLSFYVAILIAAIGFGFAKKGSTASKNLALAGKILNGLLVVLAIVMLILILFVSF